MIVVWHNDEDKQFHPSIRSQVMKAVNQNALNNIPFEKMRVPDRICGYKVEIIRIEVWFYRHILNYAPAGSLTLLLQ
jgi:hypothetical protein